MLKILRLLLVSVAGASILFASQQHYLPLLLAQGQDDPVELYRAIGLGSDEALDRLSQVAQQRQDPYWLQQAARQGDAQSYYQLALKETDEVRYQRLMGKAASAGHAAAQHEVALLTDSPVHREEWLRLSAEQDYLPAIISLYQWLIVNEQLDEALPWLQKAAPEDPQSALLLAKRRWRDEQFDEARDWFRRAQAMGSQPAADYLQLISRYWPGKKAVSVGPHLVDLNKEQCVIRLQPVVLSLDNMQQLTQLAEQFARDKRLAQLPICLLEPVWVKATALQCEEDWQGGRRLGCDAGDLTRLPLAEDFTHLLILAERGKANVHNGIMYLDLGDSYSVFVHELAHFAGFVDEYPLSSSMAENICHPASSAPNLVMVMDSEELPQKLSTWRDSGQEWTLAKARTCNNHPMQAYKASSKLTFMEYHDQEMIPPLYLALWKQRLEARIGLLPAYINIAQALESRGNYQEAQYWWQRTREYLAPILPAHNGQEALSVGDSLTGETETELPTL
ncbi:sel1 repeat family protein [Bowmanella dokdonensis]|uniref:Sel1 repeat family protein n=1 Tax=Bowmanella dokdonensis TaxID=751969 RepID=A0A939DRZ1_9ALTE|nr:sel1 repeat family protein [Bowmanella dokdonensis]MBN7827588.1 sel1 repeat family protein [Bowmanella dokdonensis]